MPAASHSPSRRRGLVVALSAAALAVAGTLFSPSFAGHGAASVASPRAAQRATLAASRSVPAYWTVASDGGVFAFGGLPFLGSMGGRHLNAPMVGIAPTTGLDGADGTGYWTVASDGGVFCFGTAGFHGSMGSSRLNEPMVGIAADPSTGGYWTVASDGGVFAFDAPFFGSMGGTRLAKPVVAMAATPDGGGYWLFASDGGVFAFGDAGYFGSMGGTTLAKPVIGAAAADRGGYWLVASDGGVFAFGDAGYFGSLGNQPLSRPVVAITAADAGGYWMTDSNGAVTAFGDAGYFGSAPQHLAEPMVSMADGPGTGAAGGNGIYPSGTYGYDVSVFQSNPPQCTQTLPSGHTIGIVQATGDAGAAPNPCLAQEAQWAGAGLNLYIFMAYGQSTTEESPCGGDLGCNFGFQAAQSAFADASATAGVNPFVTWWLDVEPGQVSGWSADTAENAQVVQGAIDALRDAGVNNVGVYTSPDLWNSIVGPYQPPVPVWIAWWTDDGPGNCAGIAAYAAAHNDLLPNGPVWVTQYTDAANGQSLDGDYAC